MTLDFTVLLPVWRGDDAEFFRQAAASVAASSLAPAELLICQDGVLTAALETAVDEVIAAHGARLVCNPGPGGLHHNLNHALKSVRTDWVARCDADDLNAPHRFETQARFLQSRPDVSVLGSDLVEFWPDGRERRKLMPTAHEAIVSMARWRSPINHNTAFYRTESVLAVGGYPDLPLKEDYALWLKLIGQGVRFANIPAALVRARLGPAFHHRRTGLHNLASEWRIYQVRRATPGMGGVSALAALAARSAALAASHPGRLIYRWGLRSH